MQMENIDTLKIASLTAAVRSDISLLRGLGALPYEEFTGDFRNYNAALRLLQISIEGTLSLANHIIARKGWRSPDDYADIFEVLRENSVIESALSESLKKMAKFRNRIVHIYRDIDLTQVHSIIRENLGDIEAFLSIVTDYTGMNRR